MKKVHSIVSYKLDENKNMIEAQTEIVSARDLKKSSDFLRREGFYIQIFETEHDADALGPLPSLNPQK